jgi:hypothetical protein
MSQQAVVGTIGFSKRIWLGALVVLATVVALSSMRERGFAGASQRVIVIPVAQVDPAIEAEAEAEPERSPAEEASSTQSYPVIIR